MVLLSFLRLDITSPHVPASAKHPISIFASFQQEGKRVASYFSIVRRSVQAVFDENELDTVENGIWNDCFQTVVSDSQCRIQHISALFFSWKHCREDSKYRHMVNEQPLFHY